MRRLLQSFLMALALFAFTVACSDPSGGKRNGQNGGSGASAGEGTGAGDSGDDKPDQVVTKPDGESVSGGLPLTKNKWCIKTRFDNANYEYRLHFQDNFQLVYTYFFLKADFSRGDLAQEGFGAWNLVDDTLTMIVADEEQKMKMRLDPMSSLGHPQLHLNPETPSMKTFNPCN